MEKCLDKLISKPKVSTIRLGMESEKKKGKINSTCFLSVIKDTFKYHIPPTLVSLFAINYLPFSVEERSDDLEYLKVFIVC